MSFLDEVKNEVEPQLCKIGKFIQDQDVEALAKEGKDPVSTEELAKARTKYTEVAVLAALQKRGLHTSNTSLRNHLLNTCRCSTAEVA